MSMADDFRALHAGPELLILPNAWDAGSARIIEAAGARAIATTSAGLAWANGWPDGDVLPLAKLTAAVEAIVRVVRVPVTTDVEGGYSDDPAEVAETIRAVAVAGAVGVNMEDGSKSPDLLCAKLAAAKAAEPYLFLNARIDVFLRGLATGEAAVAEVIARAGRYAEAGCDGVFVPGLSDPDAIRTIAAEIDRPLNVMAVPGLPSPAELATLGVRRLSAGGALASAALGQTRRLAERFLQDGATEEVLSPGLPYPEVQTLFSR